MTKDMKVRITRTHPDAPLPKYETGGAVAFDFTCIEDVTIAPREVTKLPTGLIICVPDGHMLMIAPRSSLASKKGLMMPNGAGILDQDYCGPEDEVKLSIWNFTDKPVEVKKGERLCQGVFVKIDRAEWDEGPANGPSRGGFGSTGGHQ